MGGRSDTSPPDGTDWRPGRGEVALVVVLLALGAAWVLAVTDRMWFTADFWGLIDADPGGLPHVLEPHAGHLTAFHTMSATAIAAISGLDVAWPWAMIPRVVVWALLVAVIWLVARRRGADPRVAVAGVAVLSVYGATGWIMGWFIGNPLAIACIMVAAWLVATVEDPTRRHVAALAGLLVVAAASTSVGVLGMAAVVVTTVLAGRGRAWWPALLAAVVAYLTWRQVAAPRSGSPTLTVEALLTLPWRSLQIAQHGYARALTVDPVWGWGAVAAVAALLVWLGVRRRLDVFDVTMLVWGAFFAGATILVRIADEAATVQTIRYGYVLVLLTVAIVLPRVRVPDGRVATAGLLLVAVVLGGRNAAELKNALDFWERRSLASRAVVESAAALVADGEPVLAGVRIDPPRAGMLNADQLQELVAGGWSPSRGDEAAVLLARGDLRVLAWATGPPPAACRAVTTGATLDGLPDKSVLVLGPDTAVTVVTTDDFGTGRQELDPRHATAFQLTVLDGVDAALEIVPADQSAQLCAPPD